MHVKAFGVMTRHPVKVEQLPPDLRDAAPKDERGRVDRPPREFRAEIFRRFLDALEPLRSTGKLGGLLFQFPPYVVPKEASLDYLAWAREQVGDDEMLVEFRHRSWLDEEHREETLRFLEEHRMSHVVVDAPRSEGKNVPLTVFALTTPILYVRMHGRNAETWNSRGKSAAERFDYLYSRRSSPSGSSRCASFQGKRSRPMSSSTTTTAAGSAGARSRRPRRTRRCSGVAGEEGASRQPTEARSSSSVSLNSSGCSRLGRCRERSKTTRCPRVAPSAKAAASSGGKKMSVAPAPKSTGMV